MGSITVSGRSVGSRKPLFADWSIPLPPDDFGDGGLTLRDLIERVVRAEIRAYEERRAARTLDRVFTREEVDRKAAQGRVDPEGRKLPPAPEPEIAVDTALVAFEDGLYLVLLDGKEQRDLDAQVYIQPSSTVCFLRLTFLAG